MTKKCKLKKPRSYLDEPLLFWSDCTERHLLRFDVIKSRNQSYKMNLVLTFFNRLLLQLKQNLFIVMVYIKVAHHKMMYLDVFKAKFIL